MSEWFDAIVVGGGPGGTAAAIALARAGRTVAVLERSHYDQARIGETLPPAARLPLSKLGVWDRFMTEGHAPLAGTISAWGQSNLYENHFIFNPYGQGCTQGDHKGDIFREMRLLTQTIFRRC